MPAVIRASSIAITPEGGIRSTGYRYSITVTYKSGAKYTFTRGGYRSEQSATNQAIRRRERLYEGRMS